MAEVLLERPRPVESPATLIENLRNINAPTRPPRAVPQEKPLERTVEKQSQGEDVNRPPRMLANLNNPFEEDVSPYELGNDQIHEMDNSQIHERELNQTGNHQDHELGNHHPQHDSIEPPSTNDDRASLYSNATTILQDTTTSTVPTPQIQHNSSQTFPWDRQSQLTATEYDRTSIRSGFLHSPYAPSNRAAILPTKSELELIQGVLDSMQSSGSIRSNAKRLESSIKYALEMGMSPETGFRWRGIQHECYDQGTPLLLIVTAMSRFEATLLIPIARLLLEKGALADSPDDHWRRPLLKASKWTPAIVPLLLHHGANPNIQKGDKAPPLFRAATSEITSPQTLKALLDAGADIHCTDIYGRNVLHYFFIDAAYRPNNIDNARFLVESGAKINDGDAVSPYEVGVKLDPSQRSRMGGLNPWRRQGGYESLLDLVRPRGLL